MMIVGWTGRLARSLIPAFLLICTGIISWGCHRNLALEVHYQSAFEEIHLEEGRLTFLDKIHHYPPDRPMAATPDSISTVVMVDARRLSRGQQAAMREVISSSKFFQLEDVYGAPEGRRYYPYRLRIRLEDLEKEVLYRSNPSYEEMPAPFATIQAYLLSLAERMEKERP